MAVMMMDAGSAKAGTTVMFRHVPQTYTANEILLELARFVNKYDFDFVYVPWHMHSPENMGLAFVNFSNPRVAQAAMTTMSEHTWSCSRRSRMIKARFAVTHGVAENLRRFQQNVLGKETSTNLPLVFKDGVPLPLGVAIEMYCPGEVDAQVDPGRAAGRFAAEADSGSDLFEDDHEMTGQRQVLHASASQAHGHYQPCGHQTQGCVAPAASAWSSSGSGAGFHGVQQDAPMTFNNTARNREEMMLTAQYKHRVAMARANGLSASPWTTVGTLNSMPNLTQDMLPPFDQHSVMPTVDDLWCLQGYPQAGGKDLTTSAWTPVATLNSMPNLTQDMLPPGNHGRHSTMPTMGNVGCFQGYEQATGNNAYLAAVRRPAGPSALNNSMSGRESSWRPSVCAGPADRAMQPTHAVVVGHLSF